MSVKNYKTLIAYQNAMTQLGVKHNQLKGFIETDTNANIHAQTKRFAKAANTSDSYFKKVQKVINQTSGSVQANHMVQYNEARIAYMLLQEKLTSQELSKPIKKTTRKSAK